MIRPGRLPVSAFLLGPVNDLLVAWTWFHGLLHDRMIWRGTVLEVTAGTRLVRLHSGAQAETEGAHERDVAES